MTRDLVLALAALAVAATGAAQAPQGPPGRPPITAAVRYAEIRESGDERTIASTNGTLRGIDINSSVRIEVAESVLIRHLAGPSDASAEVIALARRVQALQDAVAAIPALVTELSAAMAAWDSGVAQTAPARMRRMINDVEDREEAILSPLDQAIAGRLEAEGVAATGAQRRARTERFSARRPGTGVWDWVALSQLLGREILYLNGRLTGRRPRAGVAVEIQVHRLGQDGAVPVFLPGYNTVATGPDTPYPKIQLSPDSAELALYDRYDSLAQRIGEVSSISEAIRRQLEAELTGLTASMDSVLAAARDFVRTGGAQFTAVARYFGEGGFSDWLDQARQDLEGAGAPAITAGEALAAAFAAGGPDLANELRALEALGMLADSIRNLPPAQALQRLLEVATGVSALDAARAIRPQTWRDRVALASALHGAINALATSPSAAVRAAVNRPDSPKSVLANALGPMQDAADRLVNAARPAVRLLDSLLRNAPRIPAAGLPAPEGLRRVDLGSGSADATFNLRTIREGRRPDDHITVTLRFFRGDQLLPEQVRDEFRIRSYGWNSAFVASLAWIARFEGSGTFTPSAAMSWMASRRGWPDGSEAGLGGGPYVGLGLTTMTLNFDTSQAVELGVAPTLGVLDNHILVGAGASLQSSANRWFGFFAIRLFGTYGGIGTATPR